MTRPVWILVLLLITTTLGGCSQEQPATVAILSQVDFSKEPANEDLPRELVRHPGMNWFSKGWLQEEPEGIWSLGNEAEIEFLATGNNVTVSLDLSVSEPLLMAGQKVDFKVNNVWLTDHQFTKTWQRDIVNLAIPDSVLIQGPNTLRLETAHHMGDPEVAREEGLTARAVFLRGLNIVGEQTSQQRKALAELRSHERREEFLKAYEPVKAGKKYRPFGQKKSADKTAPDVMMILLDAARADAFSSYGYHRQTTPVVDAMAGEGVLFEEVYSTAAYTRCAVASILSGQNWAQHGVIQGSRNGGDALADSFVTLPEIMRDAGFHTIGFSENPNFSIGTGSDQGFLEFTQIWLDPEFDVFRTKVSLETHFDRRLEEPISGDPVFMYLHMLPPHAPYIPGGVEHDLWTDPDYRGPVRGTTQCSINLEKQRGQAPVEDVAQQRALYDGGLHRIDAAVGRVVASWKALKRDRELVVVVYSDHGEAFGEHLKFGHNSSVHHEMIQVPLVLWPREHFTPFDQTSDQLLSVSDIAPLLLGSLGVSLPEDSVWPRRFLEIYSNPQAPRSHVLIRTAPDPTTLGIRTPEHLAIYGGITRQELFATQADPDERTNLHDDHPDLYRGLIEVMYQIIPQGKDQKPSTEAELSPEEIKTLKSLGYL